MTSVQELQEQIGGQMHSCQAYSILDASSAGDAQSMFTPVNDKRVGLASSYQE